MEVVVLQLSDRESVRCQKFGPVWANDLEPLFNDIAPQYDAASAFLTFGFWRRIQRTFIAGVDTFDNAEVLDVCAGTNMVGIDLLSKNPTLRVTALDRNKAMQRTGTKRAGASGFHIRSVISDAHALPFEDGAFDIVTLKAASRHLEIGKVFGEIKRVLRPGGRFFHCDLSKPDSPVVAAAYYQYLRLLVPATTLRFFHGKPFLRDKKTVRKLRDYFVEAINGFYTTQELTEIIRGVGFHDIGAKTMIGGTASIHQATK